MHTSWGCSVGLMTFCCYMITTAIAVVIGLVVVNMFKGYFPMLPSAELNVLEYTAKESPGVMQVIVDIFPDNLLSPMVEMNMLPVIVIAILFGAGMIMLAMVLTSVGLPVEGIAIIAGVDKLFDMGRTTLNITGDATCAIWISKLERNKKAKAEAKLNS